MWRKAIWWPAPLFKFTLICFSRLNALIIWEFYTMYFNHIHSIPSPLPSPVCFGPLPLAWSLPWSVVHRAGITSVKKTDFPSPSSTHSGTTASQPGSSTSPPAPGILSGLILASLEHEVMKVQNSYVYLSCYIQKLLSPWNHSSLELFSSFYPISVKITASWGGEGPYMSHLGLCTPKSLSLTSCGSLC